MSALTRNILYNLVGRVLLMALGLIAVRFVFRRLGADAFGVILFTQTAGTVLAAALDLGISSTIVREVAAHLRDGAGYLRGLTRTATSLYWGAYLLAAGAAIWVAPLLASRWVRLEAMDTARAAALLQILVAASLLSLPRLLYASLLRGIQRMGWTNAIDVSTAGLQQLGTIVILWAGGGVFSVAWWLAATYAISLLAYLTACGRALPAAGLTPGFSADAVRRNLRFSFHMMSITTFATIHSQADKLALSKLLPIRTLGFYGFASSVVSGASLVAYAIVQAALPSFSERFHRGDRAGLMQEYRRLHQLVLYVTVPLFAGVAFSALPLFAVVFDDAVAQALLVPVLMLCFGFYLNGTLSVPYVVSLAVGRPDIASRQNVYALFVVLPTTVALVHFFGLVGAGLSWVFYQVFAYAYSVPRICRECLDLKPSTWYTQVAKALGLVFGTYGVAAVLLVAVGKSTLPLLVAAYLVASMVFFAGAYRVIGRDLRPQWRAIAATGQSEAA